MTYYESSKLRDNIYNDVSAGGSDPATQEKVNELQQGYTEVTNKVEGLSESVKERSGIVPMPTGFRWKTPLVLIKKNIFGSVINLKDMKSLLPTKQGKTYYVNVNTGLDTNDGLTEATAFKGFNIAIQKADAGEIIVAPGIYDRNRGWIKFPPKMSSLIVRPMYAGEIIFSTHHDNLAWAAEGTPNVFKTARTLVYEVLDSKYLDKYGDYTGLIKKASIAEVSATPNSWFTDGTSVFVHTVDNRTPDNTIKVYVGGGNGYVGTGTGYVPGNNKVYVEGIKFHGGDNPFESTAASASDAQELYFKDCEFKYGRKADDSANGLTIKGAKFVYLQNCIAAKNQRDGFNYHVYNNILPNVIEVDCIGYENGLNNVENNNNGSTMHDGGNIIRINGTYFSNKGTNVIDVGASQSWNVGCVAYDSRSTTDSSSNNYLNQDGGMWLDTCVSYDSISDVVTVGTGSTYVRRTQIDDGSVIETNSY